MLSVIGLPLFLLLFSMSLLGQSNLPELKDVQLKLNESHFRSYINRPTPDGFPGSLLTPFIPGPDLENCPEDEKPENSHLEVVFVAKANSQLPESKKEAEVASLTPQQLQDSRLKRAKISLDSDSILANAQTGWNELSIEVPYDIQTSVGRAVVIESLLQASAQAAASGISNEELAKKMTGFLMENYKDEKSRLDALATLMDRFYRQYNFSRNPGHNNASSNPLNFNVPTGNMTLKDVVTATAKERKWESGVCNDFAQAIALIAAPMFKGKDTLVVNSSTHLGVVITDGKTNHIIDAGKQITETNNLMLRLNTSATNIRIAKVIDGKLKEIAVADSQIGQVVEEAFQTGKPLLRTGAAPQTFTSHFYRIKNKNGKDSQLGGAATYGHIENADVVVVVAKYQANSKRWDRYIGVGGSGEFLYDGTQNYQLQYRGGMRLHLFHYINPKLEIKASSGIHSEVMVGTPIDAGKGVFSREMSYGLEWSNALSLDAKISSKLNLHADVESRNSLGPSDWGVTTGSISKVTAKGVATMLENMSLHLNQVVANAALEAKVSSNTKMFLQGHYQGSAIGQNAGLLAGVEIKAPKGAEIFVFAGYDQRFGGFQTQNNLLVGGQGGKAGIAVRTKNGVQINAAVRNIATDSIPIVDGGISVPLGVKKK